MSGVSALAKCRPVALIEHDVGAVARMVRARIRTRTESPSVTFGCYVVRGFVYVLDDGTIAARHVASDPATIVGTYTRAVAANDIRDDLVEWRRLAA